jgi:hypothetical protein
MRRTASLLGVFALIATGCGELRELKDESNRATPTGSRRAGSCTGSEQFIESAWWKCIVVVHGTRRSAIADVAGKLRRRGFRLACSDALGSFELTAIRDHTRVIARARHGAITFDPTDGGKPLDVVDARFAPPGARRIPPGSVGLVLTTDKLLDASLPYPLGHGKCP